MQLAGLNEFADHTLVDAVLILPLLGKTMGKRGVLNHAALNSTIVINVGVKHEGEKMGYFDIQLYNFFMGMLDAKVISCGFMTRWLCPGQTMNVCSCVMKGIKVSDSGRFQNGAPCQWVSRGV